MTWLPTDYHQLKKRLKRFFWRTGRTPEDAEDLIQDALLRLHEYTRTGQVKNREAFLIHAVHNLAIDRHRREHRHLYADQSVEALDADTPFVDPAPPSDVIFEAQQRLHRIGATLNAVSPRTREIYFAHRAGYSYAEIGRHLGISKSTIEKHIARAVLALMDVKEEQ